MWYYTLAMIADGTLITYWRANYRVVIKPKLSRSNKLDKLVPVQVGQK